MIYTVTFNPALDYVISVKHLTAGIVNRTDSEEVFFGGKGINVSVVLKTLGIDSTALGFIAGFTGKAIEEGINKQGIHTDFIELADGMSRINVKIRSDQETEVNGQGPVITKEAIALLFDKIDAMKDGDWIVLAGSIPKTLNDDIYEQIMERVKGRKINVIVDATKELLLNVLKYRPFLIKPNNHELAEMFHTTVSTEEEIVMLAKKLQKMGARNVLVSMAAQGAILIDENNQVYRQEAANGTVLNSVGAGDSMVAGFLAGYLDHASYEYALRLGSAAGSATAFSAGLATKEMIEKLL